MAALTGKVALVTGGSRGIGAAIALRLARDGADVALTFLSSEAKAREVVVRIEAMGRRGLAIAADAGDPAATVGAVERTVEELGRLDVLVNNAGIAPYGPFEEVTAEQLDRALAIHARAAFVAAQAAAPHLGSGGRIISIGSNLAERVPYPGWTLYAMSKSALIGLTKGLARELGPRGVTVNLVQPGSTDTDMNPASSPDADHERSLTAVGRYGRTDEIAATVAHLAGADGSYVTGAAITIDGGFAA